MPLNFLHGEAPAKPVTPPPFDLSPVQRAHAWWRYLWPFQSRKMLAWLVGGLCGAQIAWTAVALLWLDPDILPFVLVGGLIGGMYFGPYRQLPVRFTITTRGEARQQVENVTQLMLRMGYAVDQSAGSAGHVQYCPKSRDRWPALFVTEQDIDLRWGDRQIVLRGPLNMIERLQVHLLKQLGA